jgi:nicotinate-nucleotide adenylyltransferase
VTRDHSHRQGPTNTLDTPADLAAVYPGDDLYFITGADALAEIFTWREAARLFELAQFVGCTRPGYELDPAALAGIPSERVTVLEIPALTISSTDCRKRAAQGEPIWYLVPDGVVQYVAKHDLYRSTRSSEGSS